MAVLSDDSAESSNYVSCTTEINLWGRRGDAEKPIVTKQGVTYGPPEPELILSAAVIGVRGVSKDEKRSPIKGGRSTGSDPKAVKAVKGKVRKHKRVSFTTSRAEIPYNSGTSRLVEGRKYQVGEGVEIDLPDRPIDGVRCVILELWETKESIPYAKLKPLMDRDVTKNMLYMLTTVGVRAVRYGGRYHRNHRFRGYAHNRARRELPGRGLYL